MICCSSVYIGPVPSLAQTILDAVLAEPCEAGMPALSENATLYFYGYVIAGQVKIVPEPPIRDHLLFQDEIHTPLPKKASYLPRTRRD